MSTTFAALHSDPDILGRKPVFAGTRVPFQTLLDYIAAGRTLDTFLEHVPTVSREHALRAIEFAGDAIRAAASR